MTLSSYIKTQIKSLFTMWSNVANGIARLNSDTKIDVTYLPTSEVGNNKSDYVPTSQGVYDYINSFIHTKMAIDEGSTNVDAPFTSIKTNLNNVIKALTGTLPVAVTSNGLFYCYTVKIGNKLNQLLICSGTSSNKIYNRYGAYNSTTGVYTWYSWNRYINSSEQNVANGYVSLNSSGKIDEQYLSISSGMTLQGVWDIETYQAYPSDATDGHYYYIQNSTNTSVTITIDDVTDTFTNGDIIIYQASSSSWLHIENAGQVSSVNGKSNVVVLYADDIALSSDNSDTISDKFDSIEDDIDDINSTLDNKENTLTWDSTPTLGSTNPVTSNGIKVALNSKQDTLTFDTTPTSGSTNPVTSGGLYTKFSTKQDKLTFDTTPTSGSTNPVTSGGIKTAIDSKQDTLTFDSTPTTSSTNPVTSGGVKTYVDSKIANLDVSLVGETGKFIQSISEIDGIIVPTAISFDTTMSDNSIYPVQNKVVKSYIDDSIEALDSDSVGGSGLYIQSISETDGIVTATTGSIDDTPTDDSTNLITSGGTKEYVDDLEDELRGEMTTIDWSDVITLINS